MGRQLHATLLNPFLSQRLVMVTNKEHHSGLERLAAFAIDGSVASFTDRPSPCAMPLTRSGTRRPAAPASSAEQRLQRPKT
jgi:hypothetical protein